MRRQIVEWFFHRPTFTFSYVVSDPESGVSAIVDPVLDYDCRAGRTCRNSADDIIAYTRRNKLDVHWVLETHAHADHITAAHYLKRTLGAQIGIGEGICQVQQTFGRLFNVKDLNTDGVQFDHLFADEERLPLGELEVRVLHTPGHTNDSVSYLVGDAAFVGDTLFAPDYGTARTDFPGGDARMLYRSIHRLYRLPADTRIFLCHDYLPGGRAVEHVHSLKEQRKSNVHIHESVSEDEFVEMRQARDLTLAMPELIIPAVQVNIRAGELPPPEDNGIAYLKVPLNCLGVG